MSNSANIDPQSDTSSPNSNIQKNFTREYSKPVRIHFDPDVDNADFDNTAVIRDNHQRVNFRVTRMHTS